jgi:plastocyanin
MGAAMSNRIVPRVFGLAFGALIAASAVTGAAQQLAKTRPAEIAIDNFAFEPAVLTIAAGTEVTWVNRDEEPHTVVSAVKEQPFKSQALDTNDKFSLVFAKPGTYKYFCSVHSHMVGRIIVK